MKRGLPHEYNPDQPWEMVYHELAINEDKWWEKEFEKPAHLIDTKVRPHNYKVDHDAPVEGGPRPSIAAPVVSPLPVVALAPAHAPPPPAPLAITDGAHDWKTCNNNGTSLCGDFQHGRCGKAVGGRCPRDKNAVHQCARCLDNRHGAVGCKAVIKTKTKNQRRGQKRKQQ